jgi:probable F420-dependent oxidoreductase
MASSLPKLSIALRTYSAEDPGGWQHVFDQVQAADVAGVDRVVMSDHVVFGEHIEEYGRPEVGGAAGGKQPTGPDGHWLEPLTTLAVFSGMTKRIRLGTHILLAALRRPVVLAKSAATLDVLSGGRLDLGVGVGWQREEYEAAGLDFDTRGAALEHSLEVCQALWREQRVSYDGHGLNFEGIHQMPKPLQPGGVPLWVSGTLNARVINRLARFGSGWIPWGPDADDLATTIPQMRDGVSRLGRDPAGIQVVGHLPLAMRDAGDVDLDRTMEGVPALVDAGVTDFLAYLKLPDERAALEDYFSKMVGAFRATVGRARA